SARTCIGGTALGKPNGVRHDYLLIIVSDPIHIHKVLFRIELYVHSRCCSSIPSAIVEASTSSCSSPHVDDVSQIEKEHNMTYVNTIERVALRRGHEEGKLEAASSILASLITRKFDSRG